MTEKLINPLMPLTIAVTGIQKVSKTMTKTMTKMMKMTMTKTMTMEKTMTMTIKRLPPKRPN